MIEDTSKRKRVFFMIVLFLTLIVMIISATLAYYKLIASQKKEGTVLYTGYLQINYVDGVYIRNPDLYPVTNVNFNTYDKVYRNTFSINSSGTLNQTLSVDMEVTKNEFSPGALQYVVYSSKGNELGRGTVPESGIVNLAENVYLEYNGVATYTIIVWWQDNGTNQAHEAGHTISGKITAYSKQTKY